MDENWVYMDWQKLQMLISGTGNGQIIKSSIATRIKTGQLKPNIPGDLSLLLK